MPAALQLGQGRQLALVGGDDDLAAALVGDAVLGAEAVHQLAALGAVPRLERAGLVVEPGVNDAAVVPGLVCGEFALGLEDDQPCGGVFAQGQGRPQADDAAADDGDVVRHGLPSGGHGRSPR